MKLKEIIGPSPVLYGIRKLKSNLFFHGGASDDVCLSDDVLFEWIEQPSTPRLSPSELEEFLRKGKLTKEQKLLKSVIDQAKLSGIVSKKNFNNLKEMYEFRRKYKNYLRLKRFIPLGMVAPFTGTELSKMAYACALGSKSIPLTLPGLIGYSLPAFYFFHMSSFYAPDKLKPICQVCKFTLGAPFWIAGSLSDGLMSGPEEAFFGNEVPLDVAGTGGTIPSDLGDLNNLRELLNEMKDFGAKTY